AFLEPFTRSLSRKWHIAPDLTPAEQHPLHVTAATPSSTAVPSKASRNPGEPKVVLDELNGVLNANEGKELFDQAEVKMAIIKAMDYMKKEYRVVMTQAKINGFAHDILTSTTLVPAFVHLHDTCKRSGSVTMEKTLPTSYVSTRWNSQLRTGVTHVELRAPIGMMTWDLLKEVCECLKVIEELTLMFSQKETLLIHEVLLSMYLMKFCFEHMQDDIGFDL
ncbi:hypothetical protein FRC06_004121, partial [Ceratobasidium sp. 370]